MAGRELESMHLYFEYKEIQNPDPQPVLKALWDSLKSPRMAVCDADFEELNNGFVRHISEEFFLFHDDAQGFRLLTEDELEDMGLIPTEDFPDQEVKPYVQGQRYNLKTGLPIP